MNTTNQQLLATLMLIVGCMIYGVALADNQPVITKATDNTASRPITEAVTEDPRLAAERLIEHVNYARVALAMKNRTLAKEHIDNARSMVAILKNASAEQRQATNVESGRLIYKNEPNYHNYYFPIESRPVEIEKVQTGPFWAENKGAAVTDAEIVYLRLDFNNDSVGKNLDEATAKINKGEYASAQSYLANIISDVVKEDSAVTVPIDKASDNLSLARNFIDRKNYDGARYALGHAKDALDAMEKDTRYSDHKTRILVMRQEMVQMQRDIRKNDPTMIQTADAKIEKWWKDLKNLKD